MTSSESRELRESLGELIWEMVKFAQYEVKDKPMEWGDLSERSRLILLTDGKTILNVVRAEVEKVNPDPNSWNFEHDSGWKDCKKAVLKVLR